MATRARALVALVAAAVALLAGVAVANDDRDSGIRGRVILSPTCPVERQGDTCYRGYSTAIRIRVLPERTLVKTIHSGPHGYFRTELPPGRYHLNARPGKSATYCRAKDVTVERGRFTKTGLDCDTGIR